MLLGQSEVALGFLVKSTPNFNLLVFYCVLLIHLVSIFMLLFMTFLFYVCITHLPFITLDFACLSVFFVFIPCIYITFNLAF